MASNEIMSDIQKLEAAVEALESRNAFQDDVIEQLNQEITIHQNEIAELKAQVALLAKRIKSNNEGNAEIAAVEPPPPHY